MYYSDCVYYYSQVYSSWYSWCITCGDMQ
jgi:hypothetical protein